MRVLSKLRDAGISEVIRVLKEGPTPTRSNKNPINIGEGEPFNDISKRTYDNKL